MGNIKGISFVQVMENLVKKYGTGWLEQVKQLESDADRAALYTRPISPVEWLDLGLVLRDFLIKVKVLSGGDPGFAEKVLGEVADLQFRGVYKIFISLATPEMVLRKADTLWKRFFDSGCLLLDRIEPGQAVLKIKDFPDIPPQHEIFTLPYIKKVLEITGAKEVRCLHTQCLAKGASECLIQVDWQ